MKRLFRDRFDRKIAGVCGGLGQFLKIDPTILRLLFVLICIYTFILPMIVLYIIAWILIPLGPTTYIQYPCMKFYRSRKDRKIAGICGGLSELIKVDSTIIRLVMIFAMIITGIAPLIIAYLIGIAIIPEKPEIPFNPWKR
jgi:phage shock protein C